MEIGLLSLGFGIGFRYKDKDKFLKFCNNVFTIVPFCKSFVNFEMFKLERTLEVDGNRIEKHPNGGEYAKKVNGLMNYKFDCSITPNKARLNDGEVDLNASDSHVIKKLIIGVDPDNKIQWVWLGNQVHLNKDENSCCVVLTYDIFQQVLSEEVLTELLNHLSVYDYTSNVKTDAPHSDTFLKNNPDIANEENKELVSQTS
jgi:hypothetical protein